MSGNDERNIEYIEYPKCPICGAQQCFLGESADKEMAIFFTPKRFLKENESIKRVAFMLDVEKLENNDNERMATLDELSLIKTIKCFACNSLIDMTSKVGLKIMETGRILIVGQ